MNEADENGTSVEDATVTVRWIDSTGGLWPCERERDIFNRAYNTALEDAAKVAEGAMCAHHLAATRDPQVVAKDIIGRLRALNNEGK